LEGAPKCCLALESDARSCKGKVHAFERIQHNFNINCSPELNFLQALSTGTAATKTIGTKTKGTKTIGISTLHVLLDPCKGNKVLEFISFVLLPHPQP